MFIYLSSQPEMVLTPELLARQPSTRLIRIAAVNVHKCKWTVMSASYLGRTFGELQAAWCGPSRRPRCPVPVL